MQTTTVEKVEEAMGDGGPVKDSTPVLTWLKSELEQIWNDTKDGIFQRRRANDDTRFCVWEGQSPDGRKHAEAKDGKPPFPFENASDARVRLADEIVNERVALLVTAAMRATPKVTATETNDLQLAGRITTLLTWILKNQLGATYRKEIIKLAQYQEGGAPGLGVLGVYWHEERALESKEVTAEQFAAAVAKVAGGVRNEADLADLVDLIKNPERADEAASLLMALVPVLKEKRAKQVVKDLRETGKAQFPQPYTRVRLPMLCAHRFMDDIFYPANTTELQRGRVIFRRQWLSKTEVKEKAFSAKWSEAFIEEVLKHEGESGFPEAWLLDHVSADYSIDGARGDTKDDHVGEYEILTAFFRESNDDGVPGIFMVPMHWAVDFPARDPALLDYAHGKYPFVDFQRELLSQRQLDSRGIPEVAMTQQASLKLHNDLQDDNAQVTGLPMIRVPHNRPKTPLLLRPLGLLPERRPGEYGWFPPLQTPLTSEHRVKQIRHQVDRYFGRANAEDPNDMVIVLRQMMVDLFLDNLTDALSMMVQLAQQYFQDAEIKRVTGGDGMAIGRSRAEIQGKFDLRLSFDVRDLDPDFVKAQAEMIAKVVAPLDRSATIQYDRLVAAIFRKLDPNLAEATLQPVQAANEREVREELNVVALAAAGIETPIPDKGINFALRLQVLMGLAQSQPEAFADMKPRGKEILTKRAQAFEFQMQQVKNAQTGRVGVEQ